MQKNPVFFEISGFQAYQTNNRLFYLKYLDDTYPVWVPCWIFFHPAFDATTLTVVPFFSVPIFL
jgi:hypothetical protein